ncbi:protoporphyrinogen/coproporphyrinogen oxidase [Falsarthrobacter nasiphocae]|uniref:Oxygen-dependent protoporphyrinogen oxidase n=1 Tax=Falsarthrobacter nasiphocae TaxID=189863 RepID=A0AAE4C7H6_9MICC|nr:FAD-dependent oxidoreductase [Falsarthrobacter nasiphocae]MDR6891460.1 oxygen-dependent protoporphyrinogen oxidase [Falsarthrobacter nasiphocae]
MSRAGDWDVVVIGGGVGGLICAWEAARAGERALLLESSGRLGGAVGLMGLEQGPGAADAAEAERLAALRLEAGAESFATKSPAVPSLLADLGLSEARQEASGLGSWIVEARAGTVRAMPSPKTGLFGIPGDPLAADVVAVVGQEEAMRAAALDSRPLPAGGFPGDVTVARLVEERLGRAVLDQLVTPVVAGVYSTSPDRLPVARLHPGLLPALAAAGSLGRAVTRLREAAPAGAAVAGLEGGMGRLVTELEGQARAAGAHVRLLSRAESLARADDGRIAVRVAAPRGEPGPATWEATAGRVVLAVPAGPARELLESLAPGAHPDTPIGFTPGERIVLVTLAVRAGSVAARGLAAAPRGTGLLVAPSARTPRLSAAKAMTHSTRKWPWLEAVAGGVEIVRLSYAEDELAAAGLPLTREDGPQPGSEERERLVERAVADASLLTGVEVAPADVVAHSVAVHRNTAPSPGAPAPAAAFAALEADPRLEGVRIVGSWRSGTGLAAVVSQARTSPR